jgi:ligand-binding SRPBCC domain-containing protein
MPYERIAVFDHPIDEVFGWHGRLGSLTRLLPPWQPVKIGHEADSLRDGEAVLDLPGGLAWRARHDPAGYEEGSRFTDVLATPVLSSLLGWRHTHSFLGEPGERTRVTDTVDTRVPHRLLEEMFAYRERQLRGDLDAHLRWHTEGGRPLTVAVSGSSGLVGSTLTALLTTGGHSVVRLVRSDPTGSDRLWRPDAPAGDLLDGVDAVVHLAGESIAGRFTSSHKEAVRSSRR